MSNVRGHTRIVNGRRVKVSQHTRRNRPSGTGRPGAHGGRRPLLSRVGHVVMMGGLAAMVATGGSPVAGVVTFAGAGIALLARARRRGDAAPEQRPSARPPQGHRRSPAGAARARQQQLNEQRRRRLAEAWGRTARARREREQRPQPRPERLSWKERSLRDAKTPQERAEIAEFYRLRESGYRGPIQWNKGEMPRRVDSIWPRWGQ